MRQHANKQESFSNSYASINAYGSACINGIRSEKSVLYTDFACRGTQSHTALSAKKYSYVGASKKTENERRQDVGKMQKVSLLYVNVLFTHT